MKQTERETVWKKKLSIFSTSFLQIQPKRSEPHITTLTVTEKKKLESYNKRWWCPLMIADADDDDNDDDDNGGDVDDVDDEKRYKIKRFKKKKK